MTSAGRPVVLIADKLAPSTVEALGDGVEVRGGARRVGMRHVLQDQAVDGNRGLVLVVSGDNLRKGAALNAVQVAEVVASRLR